MERSLTTVQNAMKRLEDYNYVEMVKQEEGKTGQIKKIYWLTFCGLCAALVHLFDKSEYVDPLEKVNEAILVWGGGFDLILLKRWGFLMEGYNVPMDVENSFRRMLFGALEHACLNTHRTCAWLYAPGKRKSDPSETGEYVLRRFERSFFSYVLSRRFGRENDPDGDILDMLAFKMRKDPEIWKIARGFFVNELDYHKRMAQRFERILVFKPQE